MISRVNWRNNSMNCSNGFSASQRKELVSSIMQSLDQDVNSSTQDLESREK